MSIQTAIVESFIKDALKQLNPQVVFGLIKDWATHLFDRLQEDKNHNNIKDGDEVAASCAIIAAEAEKVFNLLKQS